MQLLSHSIWVNLPGSRGVKNDVVSKTWFPTKYTWLLTQSHPLQPPFPLLVESPPTVVFNLPPDPHFSLPPVLPRSTAFSGSYHSALKKIPSLDAPPSLTPDQIEHFRRSFSDPSSFPPM